MCIIEEAGISAVTESKWLAGYWNNSRQRRDFTLLYEKKAFYISCQIMKSKTIRKEEDETRDGYWAHFKHRVLKPASSNGNYEKDLGPSMLIRLEI